VLQTCPEEHCEFDVQQVFPAVQQIPLLQFSLMQSKFEEQVFPFIFVATQ
jgi:hypothetical protein